MAELCGIPCFAFRRDEEILEKMAIASLKMVRNAALTLSMASFSVPEGFDRSSWMAELCGTPCFTFWRDEEILEKMAIASLKLVRNAALTLSMASFSVPESFDR